METLLQAELSWAVFAVATLLHVAFIFLLWGEGELDLVCLSFQDGRHKREQKEVPSAPQISPNTLAKAAIIGHLRIKGLGNGCVLLLTGRSYKVIDL